MNFSKSFYLGILTSLFGLTLSAEIALRMTVPTGFWYRHFDISGDMTSLAELRDRIQFFPKNDSGERPILLLGDSVLGASALMEHRIPGAREKTLTSFLRKDFQNTKEFPLSLGSDGLLLPDIEALTPEFLPRKPSEILLLLNFRMFSQEFNEGTKALSRYFLKDHLPQDVQQRIGNDPKSNPESRLSDGLYEFLSRHWFLFRETQTAKTLWYYPSQKDFFQRILEKIVGQNETQLEIVEAALKQKIASYYQPYLWDSRELPLTCLKVVLDQWEAQHIPVLVVMTPQNKKFMGDYLDEASFDKNRKILSGFMKPYQKEGMLYFDWAEHYPSSDFLDHCHLNQQGNEKYAKELADLLERELP